MSYITIADIRAQGVTVGEMPDAQVQSLINWSQELIEKYCQDKFEKAELTFLFDGENNNIVYLDDISPLNCLEVLSLKVDSVDVLSSFKVYTNYLESDSYIISKGLQNAEIKGYFGWLVTPEPVKRVSLLIVMREIRPNDEKWKKVGKYKSENIGTYSYSMGSNGKVEGSLFGDPEIDNILALYVNKKLMLDVVGREQKTTEMLVE